jgi:hypothetical protein
MKEENKVKVPMGYQLETFKDLPKDIITHMPFIIFSPKTISINGATYIPMHFLYFFKNLDVFSEKNIENGHVFDKMPSNGTISFKGNFKEEIGYSVIKNIYYFNEKLATETLRFKMNISEADKIKYNLANRDNRIKLDKVKNTTETTLKPEFLTVDCDIIIPPPQL